MINLLLIEDDTTLSYAIDYALTQEGIHVTTCNSYEDAIQKFNNSFDIMLLDIMLGDGNGYDLCKYIRTISQIPIIFITALDEEANIVLGLDLGGDDYITKPIKLKELTSRINALLRRNNKTLTKNFLYSGEIRVDLKQFKVFLKNTEINLTSSEYKLLLLLLDNFGNTLTKDQILNKLWDCNENFIDINTLNVYIKRLRSKIQDSVSSPKYIETVRGYGYRWKEDVST